MSALPPRGCEPRSRSGSGRLRRYVVLVGLAPDSFGRAMARLLQSGRTVTRLHAYDGGEGLRYLLVTRASLPGEARAYAAGMDRDNRRFENVDGLHRRRDCVGNVVQLQVEKTLRARVVYCTHRVGAGGGEELEADFQYADLPGEARDPRLRGLEVGDIQGEDEAVFGLHRSGW